MIFNYFKSKPTLKEIIPDGFVDIHSHILPGIDDGSKNIQDSLKLISGMEKLGFSKIIATPHTYYGLYDNTNESILKSYNSLISKYSGDIEIGGSDNNEVNLVSNVSDNGVFLKSGSSLKITGADGISSLVEESNPESLNSFACA